MGVLLALAWWSRAHLKFPHRSLLCCSLQLSGTLSHKQQGKNQTAHADAQHSIMLSQSGYLPLLEKWCDRHDPHSIFSVTQHGIHVQHQQSLDTTAPSQSTLASLKPSMMPGSASCMQ